MITRGPLAQLVEQNEARVVLIERIKLIVRLCLSDGNPQQRQYLAEFTASNPSISAAVDRFENLRPIVEEHHVLQQPLERPAVDKLVTRRVRRAECQRNDLAMIELRPQLINRALHLGWREELIARRTPTGEQVLTVVPGRHDEERARIIRVPHLQHRRRRAYSVERPHTTGWTVPSSQRGDGTDLSVRCAVTGSHPGDRAVRSGGGARLPRHRVASGAHVLG
mgnify:CR=1 FL=1